MLGVIEDVANDVAKETFSLMEPNWRIEENKLQLNYCQTTAPRPNATCNLLIVHPVRQDWFLQFLIVKKKKQKKNISWRMKTIWIRILVARNKVTGTQPRPLAYGCYIQSWVITTETLWPSKPKIFTIRSFSEEVCRDLLHTSGLQP